MLTLVKRYLVRVLSLSLATSLLLLLLPGVAIAVGVVHVTGTVTSQAGGGVQNVSVTATAPGGSTTLFGPVLTVANGSYQLDVDPGTYDIHFEPSAGSGLNPIIANNVTATTDQTLNVLLTLPTHILSGTVRDGAGQPVPSLTLRFALVNAGTSLTATTDANGHYSAVANAGVYYLSQVTANSLPPGGSIFLLNAFNPATMPHYDVTNANLTQDFELPTATLTLTVKDGFGNPIPNAPVTINTNSNVFLPLTAGDTPSYWNANTRNATTNASGTATLTVFKTTYPAGMICTTITGNQTCNTTQTITADTNLTLQQPPTHVLSGTVRDGAGQPVPSLTLRFALVNAGTSLTATTDANGHYSAVANAGVYYLSQVTANSLPPGGSIFLLNAFNPATMPHYDVTNANLTQDFELPTATLTLTVKDGFGNPIPNAPVTINTNSNVFLPLTAGDTPSYWNANTRNATTNASGTATLTVFKTTYPAGMICTTITGNQTCNTTQTITADTNLTLQQPPTHVLSGTVRDGAGQPVPSLTLRFALVNAGTSLTATTDANGHYSAVANAGVYYLSQVTANSLPPGGSIFLLNAFNPATMPHYDVTNANLTQDFELPTATLTLTVKDGFGNPIPNAPVTINTNSNVFLPLTAGDTPSYWNANTRNATTNASGTATLTVFKTTYPAGMICTTITGNQTCNTTALTVSGDTNLLFQSAPQMPPAPTGLTGVTPTANAPSLTWNSVSVAASYRIYRNGSQVGTTTTTSFVDSAITVGGSYTYTVTSVSALGIESPASTTFVVAYTTGPTVTNMRVNPSAISVGHPATLSATVTGDVATVAAAEYFEGADPGEGLGVPMTLAGSTATATLPATLAVGLHTFTVRGRDSLGNWTRGALPSAQLTVALPVLTGRVLNGANLGVAGVQIDVVDPANHATVLATTTSNSTGGYSISATPGSYDVIFTPSGSVYQPVTKNAIDLTANSTLDVVLVLVPTTFSGTLKDAYGVPIAGAALSLHNQGGQTFSTTTAADGSFSRQVNPATYSLTISGTRAAAPLSFVPTSFTLSGGAFDLSSDAYQNLVVTAIPLTFTTTSALTGATVGQVALTVSTSTDTTLYPGSGSFTGGSSYNATTDAFGVATIVVLADSQYAVTAVPPAGSGVVATLFPQTGPTNTPTTRDLVLTADIRHFTGTFKDSTGTGITGASVALSGPLGTFHTTTGPTGGFDVEAAAGSYTLSVVGNRPAGTPAPLVPDSFGFTGASIDISSADKAQDLTVPAGAVDVTAQSSFGATLPDVTILLTSTSNVVELYPGGSFTATASSAATTAANGVASLIVTTGLAYTTKATPPAASGYRVTNLPASVIPPTGWTITLDRDLKTFSGVVLDKNSVAVVGATVRLDGNEQDQHYTATTDNSGAFTLQVAPNNAYTLQVSGTQAASTAAYLPDNYVLSTTTSVADNKTQNITVSAVNLNILARDDRLTPIDNVAITFSSSGGQNGFSASSSGMTRVTGGGGRTQLRMLEGTTYTISATPPAGAGYLNTTFNGSSPIVADTETIIEFQNHIPFAPTGLQALSPTKTSPVLSWSPVANADQYNIYRGTTNIGSTSSTSFTDTALIADGEYQYQVSAVSAVGYEGPKSSIVSVTYDTTAPTVGVPAFSVNPKKVSELSELSAAVTDTANGTGSGVSGGEYFIGTTDPGEGNATAMTLANGTLTATVGTNLNAGSYTVHVRAKDNLGTWSAPKAVDLVVSRPVAPTTLTAAASPTNQDPVLSWSASPDAVKYNVYRDGVKLTDQPTGTTYTDLTRPDGTFRYTVSAVNALGDESDQSNPADVTVDKTAPMVGPLSWSANPLAVGANTTLTVPASDSAPAGATPSGVVAGEYFVDVDPGAGSATPMTYGVGSLTATFGATLAAGVYQVGVRARDAAGNWSTVSSGQLTVQSGHSIRTIGAGLRNGSANNRLVATLAGSAVAGDTVVVAVATSILPGAVGCTDSRGNSYHIVSDTSAAGVRLFVCSAVITRPLSPGDTVTATYPRFTGLSVSTVYAVSGL